MNKKETKKAPISRNLKISRLGKSQDIPLDFQIEIQKNLFRKNIGKAKNLKSMKGKKGLSNKNPHQKKSRVIEHPRTKG